MQPAIREIKMEAGARDWLDTLFRDHHEMVFRTAYRTTGSALDAEDVLQTVFLRLLKSGRDTGLSPNPAAYLHRAAVNASLDILRSPGKLRALTLEDAGAECLQIPGLNPEAQFSSDEMKLIVRRAVAELGSRAAEVIALKYFEGLDNSEIAETLGTSQMVIAVTLHRARTRLRKEVGKLLEETSNEAYR